MLPFLREQEIANSSVQEADKPDKAAGAEQTPLQQYLTVSYKNKSVRRSTMLLAALFVAGLLCLWFMIKKSTPQSASAEVASSDEKQIEMAIAQLTGVETEMFHRMDEIVNKFYEFSNVLQVQVEELVKNPFELEPFLASLRRKSSGDEGLDIDAEMLRQQQLRQQTKDLRLLSIMQSEQGTCCMINDKILYEGDFIKGLKVAHIGDRSVMVESEGLKVELKLSE